jgi:hypothetical protein
MASLKLEANAKQLLENDGPDTILCQWFALCENVATTTRPHPVLGDVPICDRCDEKVENLR